MCRNEVKPKSLLNNMTRSFGESNRCLVNIASASPKLLWWQLNLYSNIVGLVEVCKLDHENKLPIAMSLEDAYSICNIRLQRKSVLTFIPSPKTVPNMSAFIDSPFSTPHCQVSMSFCKRSAAECTCLPKAYNAVPSENWYSELCLCFGVGMSLT